MKWFLALVVLTVVGCALPGERGWECDDDRECKRALVCRSMHGSDGYTSICLGEADTAHVGMRGNWFRLLMLPLFVLGASVGIGSRVVEARKRRRGDGR